MMLAVMSITFFVADVKCGLCEINKNNRANATLGPSPVQKMFQDITKMILDWRLPGPGPGPILSQAAQSRCTVVRPMQKSIGKWEIRPPVKS